MKKDINHEIEKLAIDDRLIYVVEKIKRSRLYRQKKQIDEKIIWECIWSDIGGSGQRDFLEKPTFSVDHGDRNAMKGVGANLN